MSFFENSLLSVCLDIAGAIGFVIALILVIVQILSNRLKIRISPAVIIDDNKIPESFFIFVCLSNATKVPFSITDVFVDFGKKSKPVPVKKMIRTFYQSPAEYKSDAKPAVLSPTFPLRFEPYASEPILIELLHRNADMKLFLPGAPARNKAKHFRSSDLHGRPYARQPRLVFNTSRGRRAVPICCDNLRRWEWLEKYAVRKGGSEGKIVFP